MIEQNKFLKVNDQLATGPGKLSAAFDIKKDDNGIDTTSGESEIYFAPGKRIASSDIIEATRVGIDYAGHSRNLPWRFYLRSSQHVSKR